ncbi:hypothetical protein BG07_5772 (plasmid) [Bacillus pseudomycoides]|uniref:hypothetical protein n=1 Tax=Bacillus TaxID=1386 RepID=UPI00036FA6B6|nr:MULTISPECIES: hypothetical protein [Bacillus]AIK35272.1 hypothetical protein DJ92_5695 [Bacillus pseudomycoides]AJI14539.1 hypothetical protein BG07_5772 [Bacillus pseudomycoides]
MFKNINSVELALAFQPILLFDPSERFYPIAAEEWLNHLATDPWDEKTAKRGSAVMVVDRNSTSFGDTDVRAGSHYPAGDHIDLSNSQPDGIGQEFTVGSNQDLFINVAGWADALSSDNQGYTKGSLQYLDLLFRSVSSNINPMIPLDEPRPTPEFTVPRLKVPTIYAEVEWAGTYPRIDKERVDTVKDSKLDFPESIPDNNDIMLELDRYIAITYYMLYPAMESALSSKDNEIHKREGQWEAITIFIKDIFNDQGMRTSRDGRERMDFFYRTDVNECINYFEPRFVAFSKGYTTSEDLDSPLAAEVRPLFNVNNPNLGVLKFGTNPLAFVSAGLHKNFFNVAATMTIGDSPPDPTLNSIGGALMGAAGSSAGICLSLAPPPLTPACIACLIISATVFLIGLILFVLSWLLRDDPSITEAPVPSSTDIARRGGCQALPPGIPPITSPGVTPVGKSLSPMIRVIDRFGFDPELPESSYPLPEPTSMDNPIVEMPTWWDFSGRWGIRTVHRATSEWDSGTRRVDKYGRSRGYWNTYRLIKFISDPDRKSDNIRL